jgi:hypothetical protein
MRSALLASALVLSIAASSFAGFTVANTGISTTGDLTQLAGGNFSAIQTGELTKLAGQASFASAGPGTFTFHADGAVTANVGDMIRVSYDFTLALNDPGTLDYEVVGSFTQPLPFPLPPITISDSDTGSVSGPVSQQFVGSFITPAIPIDVNGTYTIDLIGTWTPVSSAEGALASISVTIPPNSIDLEVIPVPEPVSASFALAAMVVVRRRR